VTYFRRSSRDVWQSVTGGGGLILAKNSVTYVMDGPKRGAHCIMTTLTRTLTLTFYQIRPLLKWKLELTKVVRCLNRSWIHDSYHSLQTVKLFSLWVKISGGNVRGEISGYRVSWTMVDVALTVNIPVKHPRNGLPPTMLYNLSYLHYITLR